MDPLLLVLGLGVVVFLILIFAVFAVKGGRRKINSPPLPLPRPPPRKTPPTKKDFSKGYDPLDDSPLIEPVDLTISHPEKGRMTFKVNRWNAEKYLKHGPSVFPKRRRDSYSGSQNRYYASSGGGFDLLDWMIFYHLFLAPNHGHFYEPSVVGARGYFDGVERDFSHLDYNERNLVSDPAVSDVSTVHDDQSPHELHESENGPVIADPFAEEKPSIPSDDEAPNISGVSGESSHDEVTASGIPSDEESPHSGGSEDYSSHDEVTDSGIPSDDQSPSGDTSY